ncbi:hypothetical protein QAD02_012562 [Eretmocerus hayati]|uniref:Uncharacterized protein n=1 Tax=Eretmocerus hayati TaxID=131215 RepID=A0ACC2P020_9HYME|nr:hypothetical protein QAD02_012562 [Eretmocerus hayati]
MYSDNLEIVKRTGHMYHGIKGAPELIRLITLHIIHGYVPEYMHAICLGTGRNLFKAWCFRKNRGKPFYLGDKKAEMNARLKKMKPLSEITRLIQNCDEDLNASQIENSLIYYSLPVLKGLLPEKYYQHLFLLVYGLSLCSKVNVNTDDMDKADRAFKKFVADTETLYGKKFMTFNLHLLLHIVRYVRYWGPL